MQSRAIPAATDGLKAGGRRVLWTARDGKKHKSASLAGATMPIHPHASPEGAINTLAAPYGNNIPLFKGDGAFGTMLSPKAYGASRYTSVSTSSFTDDVLFRDIEIVPMMENYDESTVEPVHFLPLVPITLINPASGIAVGYATNILPRSLDEVIAGQIVHLKGKGKIIEPMPTFHPIGATVSHTKQTDSGMAYYFRGEIVKQNTTTIRITKLPYNQTHEAVINELDTLIEKGIVSDYIDRSKNIINIEVKFKRGYIDSVKEADLMKSLGLIAREIENLNILSFDGKSVWNTNPVELIEQFTDWRLGWYVARYERLADLLKIDLQRYYDIRAAIKFKVNSTASKTDSRSELKELLTELGIVYIDYIADLPVYRFTEDERLKNEQRIADAEAMLLEYNSIINSEEKRKTIYITELQEVLAKYKKGAYA